MKACAQCRSQGVAERDTARPQQARRSPGGHSNQAMLGKIPIGRSDDPLEKEADRIADRIVGKAPDETEEAPCPACKETDRVLRRQVYGPAPEEEQEEEEPMTGGATKVLCDRNAGTGPSNMAADAIPASGGRPLSATERGYFEPRFGRSFEGVRLHTDKRAGTVSAGIGARAFTLGNDIYFASGAPSLGGSDGRRLMAHELAHVAQHQNGAGGVVRRLEFGTGAAPHTDYVEVPEDEQDRATAAMNIIKKMADNKSDYPACHTFFKDKCPGGSSGTFKDVFDRGKVWKDTDPNPDLNGSRVSGTDHIGYTDRTYRIGRWAIAATLVHELIHVCGEASHDVGDDAKAQCGKLPNI